MSLLVSRLISGCYETLKLKIDMDLVIQDLFPFSLFFGDELYKVMPYRRI